MGQPWSQPGTMARVVAWRALAVAVNVATSLLSAAILGPAGRGAQAALVIAPTFLGGLASLGLHGALIYHLKADPARARTLLGNGIVLTFCAGCLAVAAGWVAAPWWLRRYDAHTIAVGRGLLLVTPMIVMGWTLSGAAEAHGWFGLVNGVLYLQSLLALALLGALAAAHRLTPASAACAYLLPQIPTFLYIFARIVRRLRPVFRPQRDLAARLLRYGVRLAGVDILGTLAGFTDQIVVVAVLPAAMVGTYAVALGSARLLGVVQTGIASVLFPSVAARETAAIVAMVAAIFRIALPLFAAIAGALALAGPTLLLLAYGDGFAPAILPFRVLLLAMVVESGARILYQIPAGAGRPDIVTLCEAAAVSVLLLAMLALVPLLAIFGAALAVLAAAMLRLAGAVAAIQLLHIKLPRLLPGRADVRLVRAWASRTRVPSAAPLEAGQ
jgi:O-antigen/teichoic acid export membrane protein